MNWIEQVKSRANIVEVISHYCGHVRINYQKRVSIRCPFHKEKTPSFSIDITKNLFYCFGCQAKGDCIRFVELIERLNFREACMKLAEMYNIDYTDARNERNIVQIIANFAQVELEKNLKIKLYIQDRGLKPSTIRDFQIGWMPDEPTFRAFCRQEGISSAELDRVGLSDHLIRPMSSRILFPINGIALAGRSLDREPKYLNTAETDVFKKKQTLYGKSQGGKVALLMEGYLDACMCYQSGLTAFSCMGTAVSVEHVLKLWDRFDEVTICFDGDKAGQDAMNRLALDMIQQVRPAKIVTFKHLSAEHDPASFIKCGKSLNEVDSLSLADKVWLVIDPLGGVTPEEKVRRYQELLEYAKQIKDKNLSYLYVKLWKTKWFKKEVKPVVGPTDVCQSLFISIILHFPDTFDYLCEYLLSLDLCPMLHEVREKILFGLDSVNIDMLKSEGMIYNEFELKTLAPYTRSDRTEIVRCCLEMYELHANMGYRYEY